MRIVWSDTARADLRCIYAYIARDSKVYAQRTIDRIEQRVKRLRNAPEAGGRVPEWGDSNYREVQSGSYRVIYRVHNKAIEVVTVIHAARQFPGSRRV
jgi:addiction module RelE/StbE family toxin